MRTSLFLSRRWLLLLAILLTFGWMTCQKESVAPAPEPEPEPEPELKLPDPAEWVPTLNFDGSAASYCYPDPPSPDHDGRCVTEFNPDAPVYWEGQHCSSRHYKLAYWFWYGHQQDCIIGSGSHNNDWEHVILHFEIDHPESGYQLKSVTFFQHSGWYTRKQNTDEVKVWVGKIGHGSYHNRCDGQSLNLFSPNYCQGGCGYWDDFRNDDHGIHWKPTNLRPLAEAKAIPGPIGDRVDNEDYCFSEACKGHDWRALEDAGCWQNNFHVFPVSTSPTHFDVPLFYECSGAPLTASVENSRAITALGSYHDNGREDRVWTYICSALDGGPSSCEWTNYINIWRGPMDFTAPGNAFISGFESIHDNGQEDRIWKVKLCEQEGKCRTSGTWTNYLNNWDQPLTLITDKQVIAGIRSEFDSDKKDRRWAFLVCELVDCN
jgi:hypothetical protein